MRLRTNRPAQPALPSTFKSQIVHSPAGADIFVRSAGTGPVVVLIHGYAETSDSWAPLAAELVKNYTVIVPDLRGIGSSSRPAGGYDKKTQAADIRAVVTTLGFDRTFVVSHDIGIMVAYAYAALYPDKVERLVVMDAPLPGIAPWDDLVKDHRLWHFSFWGPDEERLVQGRERIYLDRIWNDFSASPTQPDEATRKFYAAQYAKPGAMRAGFAHFKAFSQDAEDNKIFQRTKLTMPVLAVGGRKILRRNRGRRHAQRRHQRARSRRPQLRPLAHGREPRLHRRPHPRLPQRPVRRYALAPQWPQLPGSSEDLDSMPPQDGFH